MRPLVVQEVTITCGKSPERNPVELVPFYKLDSTAVYRPSAEEASLGQGFKLQRRYCMVFLRHFPPR